MRLRGVAGLLFAGALTSAVGCSSSPGAAPKDADTGGQADGGAGGSAGVLPVAAGMGGMSASSGGARATDASVAGGAGSAPAAAAPDAAAPDAAGTDGAPSPDGIMTARAAGCGMPAPPLPMPTTHGRYVPFQVMTTGATLADPQPAQAAMRSFWVRVPADYDPNKAYRAVFQTGACGGPAANLALPLYDTSIGGSEEAIYVAIDPGGNPTTPACYDMNSGLESREYEAFALIHDAVAARFCVDEDRVFVVSRGDSVSDQLGCFFGGGPDASRPFGRALHVRGQALSDGMGEPPMLPHCKGPVAAIWFDNAQVQPPTRLSTTSFARVKTQNGCTGAISTPFSVTFPFCQAATGCQTGFPVVLCSLVFGRTDHTAQNVKVFETFIEQVESAPAP